MSLFPKVVLESIMEVYVSEVPQNFVLGTV